MFINNFISTAKNNIEQIGQTFHQATQQTFHQATETLDSIFNPDEESYSIEVIRYPDFDNTTINAEYLVSPGSIKDADFLANQGSSETSNLLVQAQAKIDAQDIAVIGNQMLTTIKPILDSMSKVVDFIIPHLPSSTIDNILASDPTGTGQDLLNSYPDARSRSELFYAARNELAKNIFLNEMLDNILASDPTGTGQDLLNSDPDAHSGSGLFYAARNEIVKNFFLNDTMPGK